MSYSIIQHIIRKLAGCLFGIAALLFNDQKDVPAWAKTVIITVLRYFILPLGVIPDAVPVAGFADDYGVLAVVLSAVAMHIDDEVKDDARKKLKDWFGNFNEDEIKEVDSKMNGTEGPEKE